MANIITIELCAEDRARLDRLTAALEAARTPVIIEETIAEVEDYNDPALYATETPQEAPEPVEEEQTPQETETVQNEPTVTKQDILQKVIALCGAGKKAETKDIITTYADSVSDLPDSALGEVWAKLTALEG